MDTTPSFEENPFQRLSAGDAISRAFSLLFKRKDIFLPIGALCYIPLVAMGVTIQHFLGSRSYVGAGQDFNAGSFLGQLLIEFVLLDILIILAKGAIAYAVASMYTQRNPTLGSALKQGCSRWCDLFLTGLLVGCAVSICYVIMSAFHLAFFYLSSNNHSDVLALLLLVPYLVYLSFVIYVFMSFILLTPVIIVERTTSSACMWRCMELASGKRCFLFCTVFCIFLVYEIVEILLALIVIAIRGADVGTTAPILFCAITYFPSFLYIALRNILESVVYYSIRVEKEGMNSAVLEDNMAFERGDTMGFDEIPAADLTKEVV